MNRPSDKMNRHPDKNSSCRYGLIGYPLGHSFSERYFSEKFSAESITDCEYAAYPLESIDRLPALIASQRLDGFNVTIPYKQQVMPYLDVLDPEAAAVGAVNCVAVKWKKTGGGQTGATDAGAENGTASACAARREARSPWPAKAAGRGYMLTGYNTDVYGFKVSLLELLGDERPRALVLGTGGASKAVEHVLRSLGIGYILVSRTRGEAGENMAGVGDGTASARNGQARRTGRRALAQHGEKTVLRSQPMPTAAQRITYADVTGELMASNTLIINTTPLGTHPNTEEAAPLPYQHLTAKNLLFDLVYNPPQTLFLRLGAEAGARTMNGYRMLVLQAERSWEIWRKNL